MDSTAFNKRRRRRRGGGPTVDDVAKEAGVSTMTVSRVINGEATVRPETRKAVSAAIVRLGYAPNAAARRLAGAAQERVALLYDNPSAAYLSEFLVGAMEQARRRDVQLIVERCGPGDEPELIARRLTTGGVTGAILPPPLCDSAGVRDALVAAGIRPVLVATGSPPVATLAVTIDDESAAHEMTRHLIGIGHSRIGFVAGDPNQTASAKRLRGYESALLAADLKVDEALVERGDFTYSSGLTAADRLLGLSERPTAIFASNDDMAAAAIAAAHRRGIAVPRDLSVVGFDDTVAATMVWPALTTVRQPVAEMAMEAVDLLTTALRQAAAGRVPSSEHRQLPHGIVRRESAASPSHLDMPAKKSAS